MPDVAFIQIPTFHTDGYQYVDAMSIAAIAPIANGSEITLSSGATIATRLTPKQVMDQISELAVQIGESYG